MPLAPEGEYQVQQLVVALRSKPLAAIFHAPGQATAGTAMALASAARTKSKALPALANIDFGLWHGRCAEELQQTQPRIFRKLAESPDSVCPPQGEPVGAMRDRVRSALAALAGRYPDRTVAVVVAGPVAAMIRGLYLGAPGFDETGLGLWLDGMSPTAWFEFPAVPVMAVQRGPAPAAV